MTVLKIPDLFIEPDLMPAQRSGVLHNYQSRINQHNLQVSVGANLFSFLIEGEKRIYHATEQAKVSNVQFLGLRAGNCLMSEQVSSTNTYHSLLFFFDQVWLEEFQIKYKIDTSESLESKDFLVLDLDPFLENFLDSLLLLDRRFSKVPHAMLKLKFEELMVYLVERNGTGVLAFFRYNNLSGREINFKLIVESHIDNKLNLEELAFLCQMSLSTFKRKFKQSYGVSPSKWFQAKRMEQAAYLLKIEKHLPSEIYQTVGFENLSSFTQAFKKIYGKTPKQYQLQEI